MRASGHPDQLEIIGTLRDEIGTAITDAVVNLSPFGEGNTPVPWHTIGPCSAEQWSDRTIVRFAVATDSSGTFCVAARLPLTNATIRAEYSGSAQHDRALLDVRWNEQQHPVAISFDPRPERIDLDAPRVAVSARVAPLPAHAEGGLRLTLTDERGVPLAFALTGSNGDAHFDLTTDSLDAPGIGALTIAFAGSAGLAPAQTTTTITRSVRVVLTAIDQTSRWSHPRRASVQVRVDSSRGVVPRGGVEALLDHNPIGTGTVIDGTADIALMIRPDADAPTRSIVLRYRPDSTFYDPGEPLPISLTIAAPSLGLRAVPVALGVLLAAWLLYGWGRPRRRRREQNRQPALRGTPSVDIVGRSAGSDLWTGRVVDAHEGIPIVGALARVYAPTFVGFETLIETQSDADGRFRFRLQTSTGSLRLSIGAPYHATVERGLPPASDMVVALASRKRLLLDRLAQWARQAGRPWHRDPEPTPQHIAAVSASGEGDVPGAKQVARWAIAMERAVFGPEPVDPCRDKAVRELDPEKQAPH